MENSESLSGHTMGFPPQTQNLEPPRGGSSGRVQGVRHPPPPPPLPPLPPLYLLR